MRSGASDVRPPRSAAKPTLYIVSNSHLDTQWNWTVQDTIRLFVPPTFLDNFTLFERIPDYVFNYEGVIHYMWFKEYYPEQWADAPPNTSTAADGSSPGRGSTPSTPTCRRPNR